MVCILFIAAMFVLVPLLTAQLGAGLGALAVFSLYWFGFCLPLGLWFQGRNDARKTLGLAVETHGWIPWVVALQVGIIAVASWFLRPDTVPVLAIILAVVFGIMNGFSEEFFWRGAFLTLGQDSPKYQALGVVLFTLWHIPVTLAHGITFVGGAMALVGGALVLGAFWSVITFKTGQIGWAIIGHVLTNITTFIGLFSINFF